MYRDQHSVGHLEGSHGQFLDARRPIDDRPGEALRDAFEVFEQRRTIHADHRRERVVFAGSGVPVAGAALGVAVNQDHRLTRQLKTPGEVGGDGGLAYPAFFVQHRNDRHARSREYQ